MAILRFLADEGATLDAKLTKRSVRRGGGKEGWTALTIAEGVFYANTFKRSFETAEVLRDLLQQRGLTTAP